MALLLDIFVESTQGLWIIHLLASVCFNGRILLGPSAFGRSDVYMKKIFPESITPVLETVANIGLLYFLYLVDLEFDFQAIKRTRRKALAITVAGIRLLFISGIGIAYVLKATISKNVGIWQFLVFMGVSLSIMAFPVLARILVELKLLATDVGQMEMAATAVNDVVAWVLLALVIVLSGTGKSPWVSAYVLLYGIAFVAFEIIGVNRLMAWMARCSPEGEPVKELYVCITLAGVLASRFITDMIGIHAIFGAFVFGLTIPKEGHL